MARGRGKTDKAASCPACGADIYFRKRPRIDQRVTCRQCASLLEVVELSPIELDWAFEDPLDDEEWDDFDEESLSDSWNDIDFDDEALLNGRRNHSRGNSRGVDNW
jgi:lysine biosynthesis protein LysW